MPKVLCIRSWSSVTALNEMETATSVSGSKSGKAFSASKVGGAKGGAGDAILILLRSRCSSFEIRAVCSEG